MIQNCCPLPGSSLPDSRPHSPRMDTSWSLPGLLGIPHGDRQIMMGHGLCWLCPTWDAKWRGRYASSGQKLIFLSPSQDASQAGNGLKMPSRPWKEAYRTAGTDGSIRAMSMRFSLSGHLSHFIQPPFPLWVRSYKLNIFRCFKYVSHFLVISKNIGGTTPGIFSIPVQV